MDENSNTQSQHKRQYDWLKGYQWVKGQSGNPGGMKKGTKSLKRFAREYLESLPDEEKLEFLSFLPAELVFRMAEGNPHQGIEHSGEITQKQYIITDGSDKTPIIPTTSGSDDGSQG